MAPKPEKPQPKLMIQKDIEQEYGVPRRDVLAALDRVPNRFPKPVAIIGVKRWWRRADIAKYFKDLEADPDYQAGSTYLS